LTGTDEHGTKNVRAAEAAGLSPQAFADGVAAQVGELTTRLDISNTGFIRTSDRQRHWPAAQELWRRIAANGKNDLYKKTYEGYYCVGHEAFIKIDELKDGLCPLHKSRPELLREENWFFKLSAYRDQVRELLTSGRIKVLPETRLNELLNLLDDAEDVSFSRPSDRLSWGIPVPDDPSQTMYVWADALMNYLSGLGFGTDETDMAFWPADAHLVGKDITRFHAIIWPAMLLSAGLEVPRRILVHGFITVEGQKMSKTLGNVVDPFTILDQWPADVVRYFFLRELQSTDDGDFYLVQRTAALIASKLDGAGAYDTAWDREPALVGVLDDAAYHRAFEHFRLHDAVAAVWEKIGVANAYLNEQEPWKQGGAAQRTTLGIAAAMICHIAWLLQPFMPSTATRIGQIFGAPLTPWEDGQKLTVRPGEPLFPRRT
jgi:methionyl-tRNA synthetase